MKAFSLVLLFASASLFASAGVYAQPAEAARTKVSLNENWRFLPSGLAFAQRPSTSDAGWEVVSLPHTWNADDPFDDPESYRRGESWYRRHLRLGDEMRGRRLFLHFEGANQTSTVYVNGAFAGHHEGGYTAFTVEITDLVEFGAPASGPGEVVADNAGEVEVARRGGDNLIAVQVDNSHDPFVPPLSVGFALYGGIYRDVWLVATDPVHFAMDDHGSSGVFVTTPEVSRERATAAVRSTVVNDGDAEQSVRVVHTLSDPEGREVGQVDETIALAAGSRQTVEVTLPSVANPKLWSPDEPALYRVTSEIYADGRKADRVTSPLGFRWFRFDPNEGFFLNGAPLTLNGTNRHQDVEGLGSALSDERHVRDLEWVKEMGANFLRLAHYPQDPAVLEAADRLGLLIWEEVPLVNYINVSERFEQNAQTMLREMIRQHHNHPSVILWGTMNEIFLWSEQGARIRQQVDPTYMREVSEFAAGMDSLARAEDPSRYTAMAIHGGGGDYDTVGITGIPQVLGFNLYSGWYGGEFDGYGRTLDRRHAEHPNEVIFVSEYGSGSDLRVNALEPERFDHSGTWHRMYHESYLRQTRERPFVAGTAIWNQFDFSQPHIGESMSHMNQKGMLTWDRQPKDVFYMYKANWNPEPMVHIASRDWVRRSGEGPAPVVQPIDVYSNLDRVELLLNGRSLGVRQPDDVQKATWEVPFVDGRNVLVARAEGTGGGISDQLDIDVDIVPRDLRDPSAPFDALAVNVGSNAQYADAESGPVWVIDQPYREGSFGYVGGERALIPRAVIITGTSQEALYSTYREGLDAYRFDVPDGEYELLLGFAEAEDLGAGARVFDILVNGATARAALDTATLGGTGRAAAVKVTTSVSGGEGVEVSFRPIAGQVILNAVSITRR